VKNKKEYLVRWKGYDSEEDSWIKEKDVTQSAITEYRQFLKNKDTPHSQLHNTHIRTIPNDLINGDNYDDPLKFIQAPKQRQSSKTGIEMKPLPEDQGMISSFFWVLIDLIIGFLGLIIKAFDNQTEICP
jgi:hypothetical protein